MKFRQESPLGYLSCGCVMRLSTFACKTWKRVQNTIGCPLCGNRSFIIHLEYDGRE